MNKKKGPEAVQPTSVMGERFQKFLGSEIAKEAEALLRDPIVRELDELFASGVSREDMAAYRVVIPEFSAVRKSLHELSRKIARGRLAIMKERQIKTREEQTRYVSAAMQTFQEIRRAVRLKHSNSPTLQMLAETVCQSSSEYFYWELCADLTSGTSAILSEALSDAFAKNVNQSMSRGDTDFPTRRMMTGTVAMTVDKDMKKIPSPPFSMMTRGSVSETELVHTIEETDEFSLYNDFKPFTITYPGTSVETDIYPPSYFPHLASAERRSTEMFSLVIRTKKEPSIATVEKRSRGKDPDVSRLADSAFFLTFDRALEDLVLPWTEVTFLALFDDTVRVEQYQKFLYDTLIYVHHAMELRYEERKNGTKNGETSHEEPTVEIPVDIAEPAAETPVTESASDAPAERAPRPRVPALSGSEALRKLQKLLTLKRVVGSHHIFTDKEEKTGLMYPVPIHGSDIVSKGILSKALKKFNIPLEKLIEA